MSSSTELKRTEHILDATTAVKSESANELQNGTSTEKADIYPQELEEPPDGGYGWVVIGCCFFLNSVTWGFVQASFHETKALTSRTCNASFGIFLSFYRQYNYFPHATDTEFAFIGGISISFALLVAPLANYLSMRYHFKLPMVVGSVVYVLSLAFAGLSTRIWQLFLTQGAMFGIGLGLLFVPSIPLINQWFFRRRALASGIASGGVGAGGLVFCLINRVIIQRLGLRWAFYINSFISLAVLLPVLILLKSRNQIIKREFEPIQYRLLWHPGFVYVWLWGFFSLFGYVFALFSLATYSTSGLGFSQARGASLQSLLSAGQTIGRPLCGLVLDRFGRINMASFITLISGFSCLAIWLVARSYGVLVLFAIVQGMVGGVIWASSGPVTAEIVGISNLGSALSMLWLALFIPSTLSEPVATWLLGYSHNVLHRTGADAFVISIGAAGAFFVTAAIILLGAKRWMQGNWQIFVKT